MYRDPHGIIIDMEISCSNALPLQTLGLCTTTQKTNQIHHHKRLYLERVVVLYTFSEKRRRKNNQPIPPCALVQESDLRKTPGRPAVTSLVDYQGFCGFSASTTTSSSAATPAAPDEEEEEEEVVEEGFQRVSPKEVVARMQGGWAPFVLDVRWAWGYGLGL